MKSLNDKKPKKIILMSGTLPKSSILETITGLEF